MVIAWIKVFFVDSSKPDIILSTIPLKGTSIFVTIVWFHELKCPTILFELGNGTPWRLQAPDTCFPTHTQTFLGWSQIKVTKVYCSTMGVFNHGLNINMHNIKNILGANINMHNIKNILCVMWMDCTKCNRMLFF